MTIQQSSILEIPALAASFDEAKYLASNRGAVEAIKEGKAPSGWYHLIRHGYQAERRGVDQRLVETVRQIAELGGKEPIPTDALRIRVHGKGTRESFDRVGRVIALDILRGLGGENVRFPLETRVLDFGTGCGRLLRYLHHALPSAKFTGTDIDSEAIAWSRSHLPHLATFDVNGEWPPLQYPDETFDLVIGMSVFTHLPEKMQFAWLGELKRVTRKGGYLALTTHGPHVFEELQQERRLAEVHKWESIEPKPVAHMRRLANRVGQELHIARGTLRDSRAFERNGFFYFVGAETSGLPSFYQTAFHTRNYIEQRWAEFFEIRRIAPRGVGNKQDLVICKKRD